MRAQRKLPQPLITGADLRSLRLSVGVSQAEVARRLHYTRGYLCNIEHGRMNIPLALATALTDLLSELQRERERIAVNTSMLRRQGA